MGQIASFQSLTSIQNQQVCYIKIVFGGKIGVLMAVQWATAKPVFVGTDLQGLDFSPPAPSLRRPEVASEAT